MILIESDEDLCDILMRPFAGYNLSVKKRVFDYRLCRARRYIECDFGILCLKWRNFNRALNVEKQFCKRA